MNCKKCGFQLNENDQFCKNCGEPVNSQINNMGVNQSMNVNNNGMMNQQPINNQPNYSNNMASNFNNGQAQTNYNNVPNYNNSNQNMNQSNKNGKYIIIGSIAVGIILIVGMVVLVSGKILSKKDNNNITEQKPSNIIQTSNSNYKVSFKDFTFEIPDNLLYQVGTDILLISDEEGSWLIKLSIIEGKFNKLIENKAKVEESLQQSSTISSKISEKNIGGLNYLTFEMGKGSQNLIIGYVKLNSMNIAVVNVLNKNNEFDYKLLETLTPIIKSVKYTKTFTNNINIPTDIDMSVVSELAK